MANINPQLVINPNQNGLGLSAISNATAVISTVITSNFQIATNAVAVATDVFVAVAGSIPIGGENDEGTSMIIIFDDPSFLWTMSEDRKEGAHRQVPVRSIQNRE